jgi:hypothetical protein
MMMMPGTAAKSRATARRQRKKKLFRFAVLISNSFRRGNTTISFIKVEDGKSILVPQKRSASVIGESFEPLTADFDSRKRQ